MNNQLGRVNILGVGVDATSMDDAVTRLVEARQNGGSGYVCVTGAHGVMESQRDETLRQIHNRSLMTVPDGMPTVWMGHEYGFAGMGRVYGPDLMLEVCKQTAALNLALDTRHEALGGESLVSRNEALGADTSNQKLGARNQHLEPSHQLLAPSTQNPVNSKKCFTHFLYGATGETLKKLKANLEKKFPGIQIVGTFAPPFRPLTDEEESDLQQQVVACKPDFFWVGLSTPKQEKFMSTHCRGNERHEFQKSEDRGQRTEVGGQTRSEADAEQRQRSGNSEDSSDLRPLISDLCKFPLDAGVFIGVGAAFDIHAGNMKDTPEWMKNSGLQWLHRLCKEPRRLWRRYLWIVPGFLWLSFLQVMGLKRFALREDGES